VTRFIAVQAAVLIALSACQQQGGPKGEATLLRCDDAIGVVAAPPADMTVYFDRVALTTESVLQANPSGEPDAAGRLFAKDGLLIRRGTVFDLVVADESRGKATIGWGSPGKRTNHLRIHGCDPKSNSQVHGSGDWLAYAGGYWVAAPACVGLVVEADTQETDARVAVGTACPPLNGPPPMPSG